VTLVHFRAEGLHVAFLGDLGHALDDSELRQLGRPDIVLLPAGGPPTIDYPLIPPMLDALGPPLVIPMHYLTPKINLKIQPVDCLLDVLPGWPVDRVGGPSIEVDRDSLGSRRVVLLESAR
jgi:L-ascorbate metabolism protein UlaG (beta-lactamase superfamily)